MESAYEELVLKSGFFDESWYHRVYGVAKANALEEYLSQGWKMGRDPGPGFSTEQYLNKYPDVRQAGVCPLLHYLQYGKNENRMFFFSERSFLGFKKRWEKQIRKRFNLSPKCPLCGKTDIEYFPISDFFRKEKQKYGVTSKDKPEMCNERKYSCSNCGGADRDRLTAEYFLRELPGNAKGTLLHIAPSIPLMEFINRCYPDVRQVTADLFMPGVDLKLDITNMVQLQENSFDYFICMHVLEHVSDDRVAMRELARILKPSGFGVLVVPIDLSAERIDEENGLSEEENWRRFGQGDHVRRYSHSGYVQRLKENGFLVQQARRNYFGKRCYIQLGMQKTAVLYIVRKCV